MMTRIGRSRLRYSVALALAALLAGCAAVAAVPPAAWGDGGIQALALPDVSLTSAGSTLIRAGNPNRIALYCTNMSSIAGDGVRWGTQDPPPLATNPSLGASGQAILPGASITITARGSVFMQVQTSSLNTVVVSCTEETR